MSALGFRLPPDEYEGESLCHRCGIGSDTGNRYAICSDGVPHDESCRRYNYGALCPECDRIVAAEAGGLDV